MKNLGTFSYFKGIQWNPSCEATPFPSEKWPFKTGGLSSGVEIYIYVQIYIIKWPFQRGWPLVRVTSQKGFHCKKISEE